MAQFRRVCWTLFVDDAFDFEAFIAKWHDATYLAVQRNRYTVFQLEAAPTTGAVHLQGYSEFTDKVTVFMLRELIGGSVHLEKAKGTRDQCRAYCMKDESQLQAPVEIGDFTPTQGKRNDLQSAIDCMLEHDFDTMIVEHPAAYVRMGRGLRDLYCRLRPTEVGSEHLELRPWQQAVVDRLAAEPDDRTVYWVTDTVGGAGKSKLARELVAHHGGLLLSGKLADMAYILAGSLESVTKPRIAVFDVSRAQAEHIQHLYSMAEMIKNGLVVSNKYESRMLVFDPLHVIFFSNQSWDRSKFSHDRVKEMNLSAGETTF